MVLQQICQVIAGNNNILSQRQTNKHIENQFEIVNYKCKCPSIYSNIKNTSFDQHKQYIGSYSFTIMWKIQVCGFSRLSCIPRVSLTVDSLSRILQRSGPCTDWIMYWIGSSRYFAVDSCTAIWQWIGLCTDWIMYWIGSSWNFAVDSCTVIWQWIGPCTDWIMYWIRSSWSFAVDSCTVILQWIRPCIGWITY